jgi:hypothetical protein
LTLTVAFATFEFVTVVNPHNCRYSHRLPPGGFCTFPAMFPRRVVVLFRRSNEKIAASGHLRKQLFPQVL